VTIQACMVNMKATPSLLIRIMRAHVAKIVLIGVLAILVSCMVPLMGPPANASGHLHHGASASCATCMGSVELLVIVFSLALLGLSPLLMPAIRVLVLPADRFHPPYIS
jgi:hypothetical protein